jgi:hypothetical protein
MISISINRLKSFGFIVLLLLLVSGYSRAQNITADVLGSKPGLGS